MNSKKRSILKELIMSPIAIAVLIFLFIVLLRSVIVVIVKNYEVRKETNFSRVRQAELEAKRDELETTLARMETEEGFESEIRNKFFVVKPNENIIVITDEVPEKSTEENGRNSRPSLWKRFLIWIGFRSENT